MLASFLTPFSAPDKDTDQNITNSDHQRNFWKKTHIKSSIGSADGRTDKNPHRDMDLLFII